jgi:hypothetical protein
VAGAVSGDPFVGSGWCCCICFDVHRLLERGRSLDDVVDFTRIDAATLAARARRHGRADLAARIHPASARTVAPVPTVVQQTPPVVA